MIFHNEIIHKTVGHHLYKTNFLLTFDVSNVTKNYDNLVWLERDQKNLERYPSQKNADRNTKRRTQEIENAKQLAGHCGFADSTFKPT